MTLLLAFFVAMYSLSQVSDDYFRVLGEALGEAFGSDIIAPIDETPLGESNETDAQSSDQAFGNPTQIGKVGGGSESSRVGVLEKTHTTSPIDLDGNAIEDRRGNDSNVVPAHFMQTKDSDTERFEKLSQETPQSLSGNERWMQTVLSGEVLFNSGGAKLNESAEAILTNIATELKSHYKEVRVEGFTDNQKIVSAQYPSNWELSAARASAVVRFLIQQGVQAYRLSAVGYGEHQPIATNSTDEGRNQNRRIVLSVATHDAQRRDEVVRSNQRLYPYELREDLPNGINVYGLEKNIREEASQWLQKRLVENDAATLDN